MIVIVALCIWDKQGSYLIDLVIAHGWGPARQLRGKTRW